MAISSISLAEPVFISSVATPPVSKWESVDVVCLD